MIQGKAESPKVGLIVGVLQTRAKTASLCPASAAARCLSMRREEASGDPRFTNSGHAKHAQTSALAHSRE